MIAKLRGLVDYSGDGQAIIDVNGVGYLVFCSNRTLARLPAKGQPADLYIETHVREDNISLFGFIDQDEKDWFKLLWSVQGVGGKVALAILSVLEPSQILQAIAAQDKAGLSRADGVGPKLAMRLLTELKDKVGTMSLGKVTAIPATKDKQVPSSANDAVSALMNLGYGRSEAFGAVATAAQVLGAEAPIQDLVRAGLRELTQ